ncbi:helix-turn-helix domain-containing protein [Hymenobacter sp. 102]|uniref:helix-turn-helix domain-containing protein n=1 Tax=Hymenobacter sp. 102 TaxID=3403152 RepID=UPI003CEAD4F0
MLDRIRQLLAEQNLSSTQFADSIGVSRPVVSHILSGRNKPSLEVVQKIVTAFPDISISWLLTGSGAMRESKVQQDASILPKRKPVTAPAESRRSTELDLKTSAESSPQNPVAAPSEPLTLPEPPQIPRPLPPKPVEPAPPSDSAVVSASVASRPSSPPAPAPASDVALAQALAEPGKLIRRIVIFYQDGTFSAYQPE